jgi:thymidylate synthase ThyX
MPEQKMRIYSLNDLTPEVRAVTFAKCSRSPESFDEIAKELTEQKSAEFHEKWVVGYGHSSVAEHAVLSIAIENVSILATKVIEDNRLASYTEKSTRYQIFDRERCYKPRKIMDSPLGKLYEETANYLFDTYNELINPVSDYIKKITPQGEMAAKLYENVCKGKVCDIVRYLLPVATLTNLGMTINARNLEWAITKLLSQPLDEMQEIGQQIKSIAIGVTPTLIKHADSSLFIIETNNALQKIADEILQERPKPTEPVVLVEYDKDAENKLVTALLYRYSALPYSEIKEKVSKIDQTEKEKIIDEALRRREKYDRPLREFEHIYFTFDILIDYGAFRDIQRHRMCTQTNQAVATIHGYDTPKEIIELNLKNKFTSCMEKAEAAYKTIKKEFPEEAQYIVPLAYKKRTLITMNLRELHHFIKLRSGKAGHISYRRIAQQVWDKLNEVYPLLAKYIAVDKSDETLHT